MRRRERNEVAIREQVAEATTQAMAEVGNQLTQHINAAVEQAQTDGKVVVLVQSINVNVNIGNAQGGGATVNFGDKPTEAHYRHETERRR